MKKLLLIAVNALMALPMVAQTEEDVTHLITNAGFDEDLTFQLDGSMKEIVSTNTSLKDRSWGYIAVDGTVYAKPKETTSQNRPDGRKMEAVNGFVGQVQGWTVQTGSTLPECEWTYFGTIPYDLQSQAIPIADDGTTYLEVPSRPAVACGSDNVGFVYMRAGWGGRAVYKQTVDLPCAKYRLEYWAININPAAANGKNLSKVTCHKDTWADETGFNDTKWTKHVIEFTPTAEFTIELGFEAVGGSGNNPFLCIDGIKLFKIGKTSSSVTTAPTAKTLTYTGTAQQLVNAGVASGGTMQYSLNGTSYSTSIPTGTNAGIYTVYYKVVGDANHTDTTPATVSVSINKDASTVTKAPTARTLTYTGVAQQLVNAGVASGGTMQYSLNGTSYSTSIPTGTNAGSYTVYYKVVGDANHNDTTPATVSVTIDSPSPVIVFTDTNVKALCVAKWDKDGDAELSEAEAASVTDMGDVFKGNTIITFFDELHYFTGITSIGSSVFYGCTGLISISIPNSVKDIGGSAFSGCRCLTSISIPNNVKSIGSSAFFGCSGLTSVTIPNSVTSIGNNAFFSCSGLTSITIGDNVMSIGNYAFCDCGILTSVTIPNSVTSIGKYAFYGCISLTSIKVGSGNTVYDSRNDCNAIIKTATNELIFGCSNTIIPNSVTIIGGSAFRDCSGLTSVAIPKSVTSIGGSAFSGCNNITSIKVEWETPLIISSNIFEDSSYKNAILRVPDGCKTAYQSADVWKDFGAIIEYNKTGSIFKAVTPQGFEMQFRMVNDEEMTVETYAYQNGDEFVTAIDQATEGDLIIPAEVHADGLNYRVVGIGSNSFRECMGLTSASLPTGITYIGEGAFRLATSLKAVTIPEGVEEIRAHSFNGCPLTTIVLPSTLKRITGTYVFRNSNAKNETCSFIANMQRPSTLDENSIMGMEYYDLYVPKGRKEFYLSEPQWDKFRNIYEIGEVDKDMKDIITAKNVTMKAGEKATLTVSLNTIGNADYNGYQFNLYLPEGISVATDENGNYLVTEKTGRKKVALPVDDGSMLFYTTGSKNYATLSSGPLMEIELTADAALAAGKYTIRIERVVCANRDNEPIGLSSSTATVTVEKAGTDTQGVITADDVEGEPDSQIKMPVFLNNTTDINAFYFDLTLPMGVTVAKDKAGQFIASFVGEYADGKMLLSCLPWDPSMGTTNNVNTWRFVATPIDNNVFHANAGRVMTVTLDVDKDMACGVYTARMNVVKLVEVSGSRVDNRLRSVASVSAAPSASWTSYSTITIRTQKQGDVNGDNTIDVADIATVIDVMAGSADVSSASADVNHDGTVDVADIAAIIDTMAANARRKNIE